MPLFQDTDIPPWLVPKRAPWEALIDGQQAGAQIASNMIRARQAEMQSLETTAQVGAIMANTELTKQKIEEANRENAAWLRVAPAVSKWAQQPDDKIWETPVPDTGDSLRATKIVETRRDKAIYNKNLQDLTGVKQNQTDNAVDIAKIRTNNSAQATKDTKEWNDAFWRLQKEDRQKLQQSIIDQDPKGLDEHGVPTLKYRGLINDYLGTESQQKIGAMKPDALGKLETGKATAVQNGAPKEVLDAYDAAIHKVTTRPSSEKPEFFTDPKTGRELMRWGSKHYDMSKATAQQRILMEAAMADYLRASAALDKNTDEAKKGELLQGLFTAKGALDELTKGVPVAPAPQEKTGKGDNDPLNLFK